jgi:hypothetical protein
MSTQPRTALPGAVECAVREQLFHGFGSEEGRGRPPPDWCGGVVLDHPPGGFENGLRWPMLAVHRRVVRLGCAAVVVTAIAALAAPANANQSLTTCKALLR